jgi:Regulator of chromosome condensation (RCC1) repeat
MRGGVLGQVGLVFLTMGCGGGSASSPPLTGAVAVSMGTSHTCAVMTGGTVTCWGGDVFGELGDGQMTYSVPTPTPVAGLTGVSAVAAGASHTCALGADGVVSCWGNNIDGELGSGSGIGGLMVATPAALSGLSGPAAAIATGAYYKDLEGYTCAVMVSGGVECWGRDMFGIGPAPGVLALVPTALPGLANTTAVALSGFSGCALLADATVVCWGLGPLGQPGPHPDSYSATPIGVPGISGATAIASGSFHACAVLAAGAVACWGGNTSGSLGDGTRTDSPTPVMASGVLGAVAIAAAGYQTCALLGDGTVKCWGGNTRMLTPTLVPGLIGATSISVAVDSACAVVSGGRIECWGANEQGQLGTGVTPPPGSSHAPVTTPQPVVAAPGTPTP